MMTVLIGMIAWTHLSGTTAADVAPSRVGANLRGIGMGLVDILGQIAVLALIVKVLWRVVRFVATIVIGAGLLGVLYWNGMF